MHTDGIPTKSGAKPEVMNLVRAAVVNFVIGIVVMNMGLVVPETGRLMEWSKVARKTWKCIPLGVKLG